MKRLSLILILLVVAAPVWAQNWTNILPSNRAIDWSGAYKPGVENDIPSATWTQCGSTIAAYGTLGTAASPATIQNAINACTPGALPASGKYVLLGTGTFYLTSGVHLKTGVVLRGAGANQTILEIHGGDTQGCGFAEPSAGIALCLGGVPQTKYVTWSSTNLTGPQGQYGAGSTQITLTGTGSTGIGTGNNFFLFGQTDEADNWPAAGYSYSCGTGNPCSGNGFSGLDTGMDPNYGGHQMSRITGTCGTGCYTISPPIGPQNFRSGQSPKATYATSGGSIIQYSGVENLTVDFSYGGNNHTTPGGGPNTGVVMSNAMDVWVAGNRIVFNPSVSPGSGNFYNVWMINTLFGTVRSNYIFNNFYQVINSYPIRADSLSSGLIENNICQGLSCSITIDGQMANTVIAHNFFPGLHGPAPELHGAAEQMNLWEGNIAMGVWADITHGSSQFNTIFRNALVNTRYGVDTSGSIHCDAALYSHNRFYNFIGNVMGLSGYTTTYEQAPAGSTDCGSQYVYSFVAGSNGTPAPTDARVKATLMRWGNWDVVTSSAVTGTNDATGTRWCAGSLPSNCGTGSHGTGTAQNETASGLTFFPGLASPSQTLPASFYLTSKPSWWGNAVPYPAIGPDVTSGTITGMGGHANLNPAANCFLNTMAGSPNSGTVYSFNANTCYPSAGPAPPLPPTGVTVVVN